MIYSVTIRFTILLETIESRLNRESEIAEIDGVVWIVEGEVEI